MSNAKTTKSRVRFGGIIFQMGPYTRGEYLFGVITFRVGGAFQMMGTKGDADGDVHLMR